MKRKVVCLVDGQRKVFIIKVLCGNRGSTLVCLDSDFRLFNDLYGRPLGQFAVVIIVADVTDYCCLTKGVLGLFRVNPYFQQMSLNICPFSDELLCVVPHREDHIITLEI